MGYETSMKKIIFESTYPWFEKIAPKPIPASTMLPDWYHQMKPYNPQDFVNPEGKGFSVFQRHTNSSAKKCIPMLDALTSGYLIPLWADVFVNSTDKFETPYLGWKTSRAVFEQHGYSSRSVQAPMGYHEQAYKYLNHWRIITPPGYSILVQQPHGFQNTHLRAISAVIDTDKSMIEILPPVWIEKDFVGVIEAGTPIVQITPFKRESWVSEFLSMTNEEEYRNLEDATFNKTLINHYIKKVWSKKSYR